MDEEVVWGGGGVACCVRKTLQVWTDGASLQTAGVSV